LSAYCDFWFPYPPLSLPLIYLPGFFSQEYDPYRLAFRIEMLLFDVLTVILLSQFLKNRLNIGRRMHAATLCFYSLLGLSAGHLIYDRLDVVMSATFLGAIYFFSAKDQKRWLCYAFLLAGALIKLVPIFLIPLFAILEWYRGGGLTWPNPRRAWVPVVLVAIPFAAVVIVYNSVVCNDLISQLSQHGERGIQIESNWAVPLLLDKIINGSSATDVNYSYGAFHFIPTGVSKTYLFLSKYVGFAFLASYYLLLLRAFRRNLIQSEKLKPYTVMLLFYTVILILMSTQRVLSPQYFIWMMPLAAAQFAVAADKRPVLLGSAAIFGLTYVVFDIGFFDIIHFDLYFSEILIVRNILLTVWMADTLLRSSRAIVENRRAALDSAVA
jgi:hypothetical protein